MKRNVLYVIFIFLLFAIASCSTTCEDDTPFDAKWRMVSHSLSGGGHFEVGKIWYISMDEYINGSRKRAVSKSEITDYSVFPDGIIVVSWAGDSLKFETVTTGTVIVTMVYRDGLDTVSTWIVVE
ncbi:MAG: hypothetical protein LBV16_09555 [Elusimicrobiota bacterium]|jgi:hypothetical protein|nr:hypothetical protein [Elusimicrobiota bacterium]